MDMAMNSPHASSGSISPALRGQQGAFFGCLAGRRYSSREGGGSSLTGALLGLAAQKIGTKSLCLPRASFGRGFGWACESAFTVIRVMLTLGHSGLFARRSDKIKESSRRYSGWCRRAGHPVMSWHSPDKSGMRCSDMAWPQGRKCVPAPRRC
ncbi:Hypothetical protein GbCGDNIH3_1037 [Granulibacter bethesdensis]|uniref:Uncharacterized protein n=1 Tax=Granulibacter bethesdensis TaxID=364410 RepID=A0AAN1AMT6_9PROT|nr:Hypothetical protein GbCGDNIH3_1037 [Granulibacter bethesdensis]